MGAVKLIDQEINQYLPHLNARQKQAVLSVVKTFAAEQKDWWDEISEEQQQAIDLSLAEMKAGKLTSHDEVMKKYKHTQLVYHYKPRKKQLEILLFWGFKQNPAKFRY